nr:hypothetical protein [Tanacetum cinerariifolium]
MGDENPIRTLRDYSKPSHEGYMNTIELLVENNVTFKTLCFLNYALMIRHDYDNVFFTKRGVTNEVGGTKKFDAAKNESRDIKWNDPNDRTFKETKEVEEVKEKGEESEEEIE